MIERIDARVRDRGSQLVIRDWTHLDFVAAPFLEEPTNRLSLADALAGRFEITQIGITRHPLDQTESILRTWSGESMPPLDTFLTAERRYAELISPIGFVRYEDFVAGPDAVLGEICDRLDIEFDPDYRDRWRHYTTITGDTAPGQSEITSITVPIRKDVPDQIRAHLLASDHYLKTCALLGYDPDPK